MRAAVLRRVGGPLAIEERPEPEPRAGEVVVHVLAAGVCHSDVHILDGSAPVPLPLVPGHEVAGETDESGPVLVYAAWGCGACAWCRAGDEQLCPQAAEAGWVRDGGYAERLLVPSPRYLLPLGGLDPVRAAPLADAALTPYRAVRRIRATVRRGDTVLVVGAGALGQFALQYLRLLTDSRVVAVDLAESKRARALWLGADAALPPEAEPPRARAVLDFVGTDSTLALAARAVEREGTVVLVGEGGGALRYDFHALPFEATLTTSSWGSLAELREVLDLARRGELEWEVEPLPLERANEALDRVRRGDVAGRLVLVP